MNIIKVSSFKKWKDEELIEAVYEKIEKLNFLLDRNNNEEYWKEVMKINDMIIEIKKRNLKIDKEKLIQKILKK